MRKFIPTDQTPPVAPKWTGTINPGQQVHPFSATDKLQYSVREQISPLALFAGLISSGWSQLLDGNPKFGSDSGAFGERFGAAMLRQGSNRILGDGVYAAAFRQDPRYYRIAHGSFKQRVGGALKQTFVRKTGSDESWRPSYSGLLGQASASAMTLGYYPEKSVSGGVVAKTFGYAELGDATSRLFFEFVPDVLHGISH